MKTIWKIPVVNPLSSATYGPPTALISGGERLLAIAVDEIHGHVYWSDQQTLSRAKLDGSDAVEIYTTDNRVEIANLQFTRRRTFISFTSNSSAAMGIALDVRNRLLFVALRRPNGIYKANLDSHIGSPTLVISTENGPHGVTIISRTELVCWAESPFATSQMWLLRTMASS
ncbi:hypothetical protein LSAT2_025648 [Lamellibrachia satsuma]|nr:hypothetical protein LSAT2_025648 [Lamellibrachia satsuma]